MSGTYENPIINKFRRPVYLTTNAPKKTPGKDKTDNNRVHSRVLTMDDPAGKTPAIMVELKIPFGKVTKSYKTVRCE